MLVHLKNEADDVIEGKHKNTIKTVKINMTRLGSNEKAS